MIRIAIVDAKSEFIEKEKRITETYFQKVGVLCEISVYQNEEWFLLELPEELFEIYILAADMPQHPGIALAREIRKKYPAPVIIFVAENSQYAIEAYEVDTYRFIPRKILEEALENTYDTLLPRMLEQEAKCYVIEKKGDMEKIHQEDIYYLKKDGKYVVIWHKKGENRVRKSLAEMLEELDNPLFLWTDKNCVVNVRHILSLKNHELLMRDGNTLTVVKHRFKDVKVALTQYWKK